MSLTANPDPTAPALAYQYISHEVAKGISLCYAEDGGKPP
jgi:hypothetical protein